MNNKTQSEEKSEEISEQQVPQVQQPQIAEQIITEQLDHANRGHALLSASSSKQWLNCPPSARLQEKFPNESSPYAREGTFMHEVCEYKLRHNYFHETIPKPESEEWYTDEVEQVTDAYYEFVVGVIAE